MFKAKIEHRDFAELVISYKDKELYRKEVADYGHGIELGNAVSFLDLLLNSAYALGKLNAHNKIHEKETI